MRRWGVMAATCGLLLSGCADTPGRGTLGVIGPLPAAGIVRSDAAQYAGITVSPSVPEGAATVAVIEGTSCKNTLVDPAPTEAGALEQLKQKAFNAGATGVASVTYKKGGTSLGTNCWSTITASGIAYRAPA